MEIEATTCIICRAPLVNIEGIYYQPTEYNFTKFEDGQPIEGQLKFEAHQCKDMDHRENFEHRFKE